MTRREAVGALVLILVAVVAGVIDRGTGHATPPPAPVPSPTLAIPVDWQQQIGDAIDGLDSAQAAITSQPATHQPLDQLLKDCRARVAAYNATVQAAGPNWPSYIPNSKNANTECKATP